MSSLQQRLARHRSDAQPPTVVRAEDALKYALAIFGDRTEWARSDFGACDGDTEHDVSYLDGALCEIGGMAMLFGDQRYYSDGRLIESEIPIIKGLRSSHIWHPDPAQDGPRTRSGELPSFDPDLPSPGTYEITIDPFAQSVHVRAVMGAAE
ncbi:hypothetical protein C6A86_016965 [Mycobacterium sp. ITM-2016-00316]|uniref:hypothetical protein n=1 Tax=Mycobacterium sp. ITM-2016-00316 TaxID=2099695 RepID=UPI000CF87B50|nr:hypothetical protein [Mycobacterium sp. ITM-2016-00316]WNG79957.1 hypothetical protein C6A86_016965 [Mycobacterium sp. ITM-2016-00316]